MSQSEPIDRQISKMYQDSATEIPSASLDQKVLDHARQNLASNSQLSTTKFSSRKWQWPISIAASVMLVSVIFINNQSVFLDPVVTISTEGNPSTNALPNQLDAAEEIESKPILNNQGDSIESNQSVDKKRETTIQTPPYTQHKESPATQQSQIEGSQLRARALADYSQRKAELVPEPRNQSKEYRVQKEHETQQAQQRLSMNNEVELNVERTFENNMDIQESAQESALESEIIQVTGSRKQAARDVEITEVEAMEVKVIEGSKLTMESFSTLDVDYLDALVLDLQALKSHKSLSQQMRQETSFMVQPSPTDKTSVLSEEERLQQAIYDELLAFKTANPNAQLPEKYLTKLAKNQLVELFNAVGQDQPKSPQDKDDK